MVIFVAGASGGEMELTWVKHQTEEKARQLAAEHAEREEEERERQQEREEMFGDDSESESDEDDDEGASGGDDDEDTGVEAVAARMRKGSQLSELPVEVQRRQLRVSKTNSVPANYHFRSVIGASGSKRRGAGGVTSVAATPGGGSGGGASVRRNGGTRRSAKMHVPDFVCIEYDGGGVSCSSEAPSSNGEGPNNGQQLRSGNVVVAGQDGGGGSNMPRVSDLLKASRGNNRAGCGALCVKDSHAISRV